MSVIECNVAGKPGYRYGETGTVFIFDEGDEVGRRRAKQNAHLDGARIEAGMPAANALNPPLLPDTLQEDGSDGMVEMDGVTVGRSELQQLRQWIDELLAAT